MAAVLFAITMYQVNNLYTQEIEIFKDSSRNTREQSLKNYVSLAPLEIRIRDHVKFIYRIERLFFGYG